MILNSQVRSDGTWPLYADRLLHGARLYSDLHTPLQPFFYLEMAGWQSVAGNSWLASLVLPVIHLFIFIVGYYLLTSQSDLLVIGKAIFLAASFTVAIGFDFYKFEDFHVVSDIQYVFSSFLLWRLRGEGGAMIRKILTCAFIGVMAGISFTTRANEGFFLYLADGAVLFAIAENIRWRAILSLTLGFSCTCLVIVLMTGDTIGAYFRNSLTGAQSIKGGALQLLLDPASLMWAVGWQLVQPAGLLGLAIVILMIAAPTFVLLTARNRERFNPPFAFVAFAAIALAVDAYAIALAIITQPHFFLWRLAPVLTLAIFCLTGAVGLSTVGAIRNAQSRASLVLLPAAMLAAQSMSSGGHTFGQWAPIGLFIALAPTLYPTAFKTRWVRISAIVGCAALAASGVVAKVTSPAVWEYYQSEPMFADREWITHPIYGPMYVDDKDNTFFRSVCERLGGYRANVSLLSLPYSYANYYCGVDPWHDYVQTWFDTTSQAVIRKLISQLRNKPPGWILYERQLKFLHLHETFYFHGGRIAQQDLDQFIMGQVDRDDWKVELADEPRPGDRWMLIRTSTPAPSTAP
jgi:hypothetical protein